MARRTLRSRFAALPAPLRRRRVWAIGFLLFLALIGFFVIRPFWKLTSQFEDLTFRQPSRIYARATRLYPGRPFPVAQLLQEIEDEGYRPYDGPPPVPAGRYIRTREGVALHQRGYPTPEGRRGGHFVEISYGGSRIRSLAVEGQPAEEVVLDPPLLASYYGPDLQERRPIPLDEVSEDLVQAVIAAEDDNFFRHSGVSFSGIARAVWVNARGHGVRQGGSTLTQQLVKNLYLTHERTLTRKSQEILLALLLELRYSKREILAAYLNEIYLGGAGKVSLLGVGAASRAYFGKDADQLDLAEAATLAGMIQAPAAYSPLSHPEKARQRRDWVLGRMAKLGSVPQDRIDQALETPLTTFPEPMSRPRASYFADAMGEEAKRRFQIEDLADGGYLLFSTLSWRDQQAAEAAVDQGLEKVEAGYQKGYKGTGPLQAALVSVDPEAGGILAYVGGRSYRKSQFDRAGRALRQPGSAFKPIVYSAAFESHKFTPTTLLDDAPLTMRTSAGKPWSPKNDDGQFHGWVTVRRAMERSYNLATARLALQVGLPEIIQLAHDMGISVDMDPFPSVALGAIDATPVELATVYSTLASGGMRTETHGLIAVLDRYGKRVEGKALAAKRRVLSPQSSYMVTSLLQGVLVRGTAGGAARSIAGDLAGKTGTTNKRRDSWFAGYSPDRATVVWVGYDDNSSTRLSGARAALPIWTRFAGNVAPAGGYPQFQSPAGITTALIDPSTGLLATEYCPTKLVEVFREGQVPTQLCDKHQSYFDEQLAEGDVVIGEDGEVIPAAGGGDPNDEDAVAGDDRGAARDEKRHPIRRWFKKVFGGDDGDRKRDERPPAEPPRQEEESRPPV